MDVEYIWFKDGKAFIYTLDLEGKYVTRDFWDNGNVKTDIFYDESDPTKIESKIIYRKDGSTEKEIETHGDDKYIYEYNNNGKLIIWLSNHKKIHGSRRTYDGNDSLASIDNEPAIITVSPYGEVDISWLWEDKKQHKDKYLGIIPPQYVEYNKYGSLKSALYQNYHDPNAVVIELNVYSSDHSVVEYKDGDGDGDNVVEDLNRSPDYIQKEVEHILSKTKDAKNYYVKKYITDIDDELFDVTYP